MRKKRSSNNKKFKELSKKDKCKRVTKIFFKTVAGFLCVSTIVGGIIVGTVYYKLKDKISVTIRNGYEKVALINEGTFKGKSPTVFLDKNGKVLKEFKDRNFEYVEYEKMNPLIEKAFVAIEDERFYSHNGIDFKGLLRAGIQTVLNKNVQGGSTITQQLTKNVFLTPDISIWRKLEEMVISQELEDKYSKQDIIEFYVNNIYFGYGCYGIESASKYFYGKSTKDLELHEVATLISTTNNPTIFDPILKPENNKERRDLVLFNMKEQGMITEEEYTSSKEKEIKLNIKKRSIDNTIATQELSYAVDNAVKVLMEEEGFIFRYSFKDNKDRENYFTEYNQCYEKNRTLLLGGGFKVSTSIDLDKQNKLQEVVDANLRYDTSINKNTKKYDKQAGAVVINNQTGEVEAIVGGRTMNGKDDNLNRAYQSPRQPGSTMKPIISYIPSFENGYLPHSTYVDAPIQNGPKNWYGGYKGSMTLRYAVEQSVNTVAYRLAREQGIENSLNNLKSMEFKYLYKEDENPIIALGGMTRGATVLEMTSAYATIARNGEFIKPTNIEKIEKTNMKETIYENKKTRKRIYSDSASYLMTDVLKSTMKNGTARGRGMNNWVNQVAKTGTTDKNKDSWFAGYTPYYTCVVWTGYDTPREQYNVKEASYIWKDIMTYFHKGLKDKEFEMPKSIYKENGRLYSKISNNKTEERKRKIKEENRIKSEYLTHKKRLEDDEYRIVYGLTLEEEIAREELASSLISQIENFNFDEKEKYGIVKEIIEEAEKSLESVKRKVEYNNLRNRLSSAKYRIESIYIQLTRPPVIDIPTKEEEEDEIKEEDNIQNDNTDKNPTEIPKDPIVEEEPIEPTEPPVEPETPKEPITPTEPQVES